MSADMNLAAFKRPDTDAPDDRMQPLSPAEREWKETIYQRLLKVLDLSLLAGADEKDARRQIREVCDNLISEERAPLSIVSRHRVIRRIEDEVLGLGPLEPLLADKTVSDILVNGARQVYVERRGKLELTNPRRWSMPDSRTVRVSTRSFRHWRSMAQRCPSDVSRSSC
jgi:pilus assembly protein CpaF